MRVQWCFISERVAKWQSTGNARRKSNRAKMLKPVKYFANRGEAGKEGWPPGRLKVRGGVAQPTLSHGPPGRSVCKTCRRNAIH